MKNPRAKSESQGEANRNRLVGLLISKLQMQMTPSSCSPRASGTHRLSKEAKEADEPTERAGSGEGTNPPVLLSVTSLIRFGFADNNLG